ncbi:MAG TPA: 4-hydroxy-tetrahydrodipicolinate synthase [Candidatus Onthomonas avicola]|nr:4-hydroxy-tetrahydrodipicolinate synthase [Candidatus Onthomonas avicola]
MKQPIFTGSCVAIVTPFHKGGVDFEKLGQLIEFQIANGTDAICICGTTGESSTQSMQEHMDTVEYAVKKVAGRCKVIAGSGSNDTAAALTLSLHAESAGADGLLMVTPYYNKATQTGLIRHYEYVADRVHTPIILYHVPSRTNCSFKASTYAALAKHPMINGIKEASGNFNLVSQTVALCGDEMNIWSGDDATVVPMMAMGGKGVISVLANILPQVVHQMAHLCLDGNFAEAAKLQARYQKLNDALFIEVNPIPVKTAMNLIGMDAGELRLPLCEMEPANLATLQNVLREYGLLKG